QWVLDHVLPERIHNREPYRRDFWWLFGRRNTDLRRAITDVPRYAAAPVTSKHRFFVFLPAAHMVDSTSVAIALDDGWHLGVLNSRLHSAWALRAGTRLGVGNDPRY